VKHTRIAMKIVWRKPHSQEFLSSGCFIKHRRDYKIKDYEMGRVCNTHGTLEQCILNVSQKVDVQRRLGRLRCAYTNRCNAMDIGKRRRCGQGFSDSEYRPLGGCCLDGIDDFAIP